MSGMPKTSDGSVIYRDAAEWFKHRSYDYRQFSDLEALRGSADRLATIEVCRFSERLKRVPIAH
jgi:hypothetical protein